MHTTAQLILLSFLFLTGLFIMRMNMIRRKQRRIGIALFVIHIKLFIALQIRNVMVRVHINGICWNKECAASWSCFS